MNTSNDDIKDIDRIRDIRDTPIKMLRGFFSGIGQLLLAADRFRAEEPHRAGLDHDDRFGSAEDEQAEARRFRSLDATGNVRLLTHDTPAEPTKPPGQREPPPAVDLPVPGYDGRSLASIRSRLRYLDANQLRILLEHEKSALNRADIVRMLERRLTKIESGPDVT
jgi:hypothetical protein